MSKRKCNKLMVLHDGEEAARFSKMLDETWMTTHVGGSLMGRGFAIIVVIADLIDTSEQHEKWINKYLKTKVLPGGEILFLGGDYVC